MAILVTGGAGYIGSHTARLLRRHGYDVVVLDTLELGHREAVGDVPIVVGNIADRRLVAETVRSYGIDAVVHFAAYKAAGESMAVPGRYFSNNVGGSAALFDALYEAGVGRLVFSSTCAVYGTPEALPVDERQPLRPESPYGESKAMVERMLHWYDVCHGLRSVSLRYFNAAGAAPDGSAGEDWTLTANLVPVAMKALLGRIPELKVFGTDYPTPDGTAVRDYIHVDDLADAHLRALAYLDGGGPSDVFNLGTGTGSTVRQVIAAAGKAAGRPVPFVDASRRGGDPVALYADNAKAHEVLGWSPRYDLMGTVASAWAWHSAHPDGYAPPSG
ncbi:MAG: UDP-glucose 4-epimerase GalE [Acidimicrobiales bacterium]